MSPAKKQKTKQKTFKIKNVEAQSFKISHSSCVVRLGSSAASEENKIFNNVLKLPRDCAALMRRGRSFHGLLTSPEPAMNSSRGQI